MSAEDTPRTWTLNFQNGHFFPLSQSKALTRVEVIELQPVLDLLEGVTAISATLGEEAAALRDAETLLRAHGRLQTDDSERGEQNDG